MAADRRIVCSVIFLLSRTTHVEVRQPYSILAAVSACLQKRAPRESRGAETRAERRNACVVFVCPLSYSADSGADAVDRHSRLQRSSPGWPESFWQPPPPYLTAVGVVP